MTYTLSEISDMATVHVGQYDNFKVDTDTLRVMLSRIGAADGMPYDNQVTVERLVAGVWTITEQYEAKD